MRESFFAAPQAERPVEPSPEVLLEKNKEHRELVEDARATWMENVMQLKNAFPLDDVAETPAMEAIRPRLHQYLAYIDELDRLEQKLNEEKEQLEQLLAN